MSLLRGPEWPDKHADEGHHEFVYSLYPHGGSWQQAITVRNGYELNYPAIAVSVQPHAGPLSSSQSFFSADADNVVVTGIKKDEDDDNLTLRFYEWAGKKTDVHLKIPIGISLASETNLMEVPEREAAATVTVTPFEIKTVKLVRSR